MKHRINQFLAALLVVFAFTQGASAVTPQGIPQIPAFLPMMHSVPQTKPQPIDGEWIISSLGKRIRIQAGRAFAVDPWVHMFVLKVNPGMVVIKDIKRTGPKQFGGQDLPLMGAWQADLTPDGSLGVSVQTMLGPVRYALSPVSLDNPRAFARLKGGRRAPPPEPEYEAEDEYEYSDEDEYSDDDYADDYSDEDEDESEYSDEDESADWDGW